MDLTPGARVVFYSDGITEAEDPDGQQYGEERLRSHVVRDESCLETLLTDVRAFADGAGLRDDATVISVKLMH